MKDLAGSVVDRIAAHVTFEEPAALTFPMRPSVYAFPEFPKEDTLLRPI